MSYEKSAPAGSVPAIPRPTPKSEWVRAGDLATINGVMFGRVEKVVNAKSLPYAVVKWPTSTGRHTITTLRKVDPFAEADRLFPESTDPEHPKYCDALAAREVWLADHAPQGREPVIGEPK